MFLLLLFFPLIAFSAPEWKAELSLGPQTYAHQQTGKGIEFSEKTGSLKSFGFNVTKKVYQFRFILDYNHTLLTIDRDDKSQNITVRQLVVGGYYRRFFFGVENTWNPYFFDNGKSSAELLTGQWLTVGYRMPVIDAQTRIFTDVMKLVAHSGSSDLVKDLGGYGALAGIEHWQRFSGSDQTQAHWIWRIKAYYLYRKFDINSSTSGAENLVTGQGVLSLNLGRLF